MSLLNLYRYLCRFIRTQVIRTLYMFYLKELNYVIFVLRINVIRVNSTSLIVLYFVPAKNILALECHNGLNIHKIKKDKKKTKSPLDPYSYQILNTKQDLTVS